MTLTELLGILNQGWIGLLLTVFFGILAYYFYRWSVKEPALVYKSASLILVGDRQLALPNQLQILYNGSPVTSVKKTWIIFWNAGSKEFLGQNISRAEPIGIFCENGSILDVRIIRETNPANAAKVLYHGGRSPQYQLGFDYFNAGDGVTFEVIHSELASKIRFSGQLIGARAVRPAPDPPSKTKQPAVKLLPYVRKGGAYATAVFWALFVGSVMLGVFGANNPIFTILDRIDALGIGWLIFRDMGLSVPSP